MPYIKKEERPKLDSLINELSPRIGGVGELNYVFTRLAYNYLRKDMRYAQMAGLFGTYILSALEVWWRKVRFYEDEKSRINGDVE
jgi:hypothetical protein